MLISPNIHEAYLPVDIENQVVLSLSAYLLLDQTSIFGHWRNFPVRISSLGCAAIGYVCFGVGTFAVQPAPH